MDHAEPEARSLRHPPPWFPHGGLAPLHPAQIFTLTCSRKLTNIRKTGKVGWLRPDAESQVSVRYVDDKPVEITNVVISTQHSADVQHSTIKEFCIEEIVK